MIPNPVIKPRIRKLILLAIYTMTIGAFDASGQSVIELLSADVIEYDQEFVDAERVKGNVRFKQDEVFMNCDSAYFYRKDNKIEAYGNIYIRQRDTFNLWGDYLEYDGDKKQAYVQNNVRLKDQEMELTTDLVQYDVEAKTAFYSTGGKIVNGSDRLTSRQGRYYSRSKAFFFKDSVELINPEYRMKSDTLSYNTVSKIAYFFGPTYIYSEENTIFCRYGWYNTIMNTSQFSKGVWIEGKDNKLVADSLEYNRNTGIGQAYRNITLLDTVEQIKIEGQYGISYRLEGKTMITGEPLAIKYFDDDSLYVKADTLIDQTDTNGGRRLSAFYNTRIHKSDMQGIADSLIYGFTDSTISMLGDPVLWTEENQITGDTLIVYRKNGQLHKLDVIENAFIVSYVEPEVFNQIDGNDMIAFFRSNRLHKVRVEGNGQSVYYVEENDSSYTGVNHMICSDMLISVEDNTVSDVRYYGSPSGGFYPVNELPGDKKKLPNFIWLPEKRPTLNYFLNDKVTKDQTRPDTVKDLFEEKEMQE
jgi:lipopolysaccharide export system protein LptA